MDQHELVVRALAILGLGGVGVYLMLPRGDSGRGWGARHIGAALATAALGLLIAAPVTQGRPATVLWPLSTLPMSLTFYLLAIISLASAVLMITSRNPVYSALWFALVLLSNSGLYFLQGAEFLAAATQIIYAGAIIVTFLFVIMLAQPSGAARYDRVSREPFLAALAGVLLSGALLGTIEHASVTEPFEAPARGNFAARPPRELAHSEIAAAFVGTQGATSWRIAPDTPHVEGLGTSMFLEHYVSVEVVGLLLLVAVVGAMLIASHRLELPYRSSTSGNPPVRRH